MSKTKITEAGISQSTAAEKDRQARMFAAAQSAADEIGEIRAGGGQVCDISHVVGAMRAADASVAK